MATSPQTKTNGTKPAAAKRAPQAATQHKQPPKPELTRIQLLIADLVGDLIAHGGREEDTDCVVWAAAGHNARRFLSYWQTKDPAKYEKEVDDFEQRDFKDWSAELRVEHKRNPKPELPDNDFSDRAKTVSEQVRAHALDQLVWEFGEFLESATPEEGALMREVLLTHRSSNRGVDSKEAEIPLAEGFADAIGADHTYIKVPRSQIEQVEQFVKALAALKQPPKAA